MNRELALKIVLVFVGLLFIALVYPLTVFVRLEAALAMMLSLYVTLGVFLLLATRNPAANRSLIAFTAWSSFVHAALMGTQALLNVVQRGELWGVAVLIIIGIALIVLAPERSVHQASGAKTPTSSSGRIATGSRETEQECSPRRQPWVNAGHRFSPVRAQEAAVTTEDSRRKC